MFHVQLFSQEHKGFEYIHLYIDKQIQNKKMKECNMVSMKDVLQE